MVLHVELEFFCIWKGAPTDVTWRRLVLSMGTSDVAVVRGVRCEGLSAMLALERPLSRVLANMRAQNTGSCEGLARRGTGWSE